MIFVLCSTDLVLFVQGTQRFASAEVTDEDDKQILDCLEHVSFCWC
jgi:hypothetical protein